MEVSRQSLQKYAKRLLSIAERCTSGPLAIRRLEEQIADFPKTTWPLDAWEVVEKGSKEFVAVFNKREDAELFVQARNAVFWLSTLLEDK